VLRWYICLESQTCWAAQSIFPFLEAATSHQSSGPSNAPGGHYSQLHGCEITVGWSLMRCRNPQHVVLSTAPVADNNQLLFIVKINVYIYLIVALVWTTQRLLFFIVPNILVILPRHHLPCLTFHRPLRYVMRLRPLSHQRSRG